MEFFIYKDGRQQGPFTIDQLAGEGISSETLVWRDGMEGWLPAWQVPELKDLAGGKAKASPPPPPATQPEEGEESPQGQEPGEHVSTADATAGITTGADKRRRRPAILLAVAAVAFLVLLLTCPGKEEHRQAVSAEITAAIKDKAYGTGIGGGTMDMLGGMFYDMIAPRIVDALVSQFVTVDNYFIFSTGSISYGGESHTVSFGILGHVFTFDSGDISRMLDREQPLPGTMAI